ncbi:MAG TPA: Zn-ribbon domain-containing OB-fold protein [Deltaproteobacteria bacterium]|nr:Zn-ribbon domain-containing OB-fold protein [Deltaproteobacteria bacterium]
MDAPVKPKPVPVVNPWARPFWEGTKQGKLLYQKCKDCGTNVFYPRIACISCFSDNLEWVESSGKGTVYTYTVVKSNSPTAFLPDLPYVIAIVKLEEDGVQMLSNIVGCDPDEVRCDMPVEVTFEKLNDEFVLPKFKPFRS